MSSWRSLMRTNNDSRWASDKGIAEDEQQNNNGNGNNNNNPGGGPGVLQDSWVELTPPSRGSLCSSTLVDGNLLIDAQNRNVPSSKGSRHSPKSLSSPNTEFANLELVKEKLSSDMLPPGKHSDWIWDWSSRPEATPPKEYRRAVVSTTPPNSPVSPPSSRNEAYSNTSQTRQSLRHSTIARSPLFRVDVVFGIVVSNLFTFIVGACIGYYFCKRVTKEGGNVQETVKGMIGTLKMTDFLT